MKLTPEEERKKITQRLNNIRRENPVYFDKIIRDKFGPPPSHNKKKKPKTIRTEPKNGDPAIPSGRNKSGKVTKYLLNKGGSVKK